MWCLYTYVGVFSEKVYEKMPLKLTKLHNVSITTVTLTEKSVLVVLHKVYTYVCILEHTRVHLCLCMCMPVFLYVRMYVCMYVCMDGWIHVCNSVTMCVSLSLLYSMIVTGDAVGCVKFFDNDLKMLNWYVHYCIHI